MKKSSRIFAIIASLLVVCTMLFTMTGCNNRTNNNPNNNSNQLYDKHGNSVQMPTDNDEEGWFSVEVVNKYSVAALTQPEGTTVVSKPEPEALYLSGDKNTFKNTVSYVFEAICSSNSNVYTPVLGIGEDSVATVTELDPITHIDTDSLYPKGDVQKINLIYKSGHKLYECTISLENNNEQVYIAFADRTELYASLV